MMRQPKLNRRLALETPVDTADGAGGWTRSWQVLGHLWAELKSGSGREGLDAGLSRSEVTYRITVRAAKPGAPSRPRPEQRFREGSRVFLILAVADADPSGRYLLCHAREEVVA